MSNLIKIENVILNENHIVIAEFTPATKKREAQLLVITTAIELSTDFNGDSDGASTYVSRNFDGDQAKRLWSVLEKKACVV